MTTIDSESMELQLHYALVGFLTYTCVTEKFLDIASLP